MKFETVIYGKKEGVAIISLNRPEVLNAQNRQLVKDFFAALKEAEADSEVKVVVIKGEGQAFCSGDDLSEEHHVSSIEEAFRIMETLQDTTRTIMGMPKPVIAAIHGYALGAGCEWAMNCDLRIAAEHTKLGFPEARVGMTVTNAGTKLLPLLVGLGRAKELVYLTDFIEAEVAEQWGLVNKVVPLEDLEKTAFEMAQKIAQKSSLAITLSKKALNQGIYRSLEETLEQEMRDLAIIFLSSESTERMRTAQLTELKKPRDQAK
jgi:enoyl-CoA hydratase/carnithine racemase